jgi:hypothetical protein
MLLGARFSRATFFIAVGFSLTTGCARSPRAVPTPEPPQQAVEIRETAAMNAFWSNLQQHCGRAFPGGLGVEPPGDDMLQGDELLIAHFRDCGEREMRIAFHIEPGGDRSADRSRTWVLRRIEDRIELRHDHRKQDGTADESTWYGAFSSGVAAPHRMEFEYLDGTPMPGVWRGWRLEIEPNRRYSYGTVRNGEWSWRVDFDLSRSVELPPPAWGHRAPGDTVRAMQQAAAAPAAPAGPPTTDIHLVPLTRHEGRLHLGEPRNITNRAGYDNQPSFTPDGRALYYTSIRADGQADIYRYDIASGSTARFTDTPESEYSPTVMPDGREVSTVRVERDSTQRLWRFPIVGGTPSLVLERVAPVGYHAWGDDHTLALFVLGSPATLRLADTRTGDARVIASDVGRALQRMPSSDTITYMLRVPPGQWRVTGVDFRTGGSRQMTVALEGSQDFAWTPDGTLLMARQNTVYAWRPGADGWVEAGRFDAPALQRITRMAVSPDGATLAVVSDR